MSEYQGDPFPEAWRPVPAPWSRSWGWAQVYGIPIRFSSSWNDTTGLALVGGFENVLVGLRSDLTFDLSDGGRSVGRLLR
jgi:hypothetical protein